MRLVGLPISVAALLVGAACGSFSADPSTPGVGPSSEAGASDGFAGAETGSSSGDLLAPDSGPFDCPPDKTFVVDEKFDVLDVPNGWQRSGELNTHNDGQERELAVVNEPFTTGTTGGYLRGQMIALEDDNIFDAPTIVQSGFGNPSAIRLEYDLAVTDLARYSELGCQLEIWGNLSKENVILLYLGTQGGPDSSDQPATGLIAGWDYKLEKKHVADSTDQALVGFKAGTWQHVVIDAKINSTVEGTQVIGSVSIGGNPPTNFDNVPEAAFAVDDIHVRCGLLFLKTKPKSKLRLGIDNVRITQCGGR